MNKNIQNILQARREKLESIKNFISLKLYHDLDEKLNAERHSIEISLEAAHQEQEKRLAPQILPKIFFEQRFLKVRQIRID